MSIINETNYKRIQDILVGGLQYYPRTTTDYVWDPERKKTLKDVLDDISGGGGGSPGGPVSWSNIQNKPNTLFGFGILDAYTKSEVNSLILNIPTGVSTWGDIQNKPAWIGSSKPSYTAAEVGAISINAELFSGNYQDLANKPALGTLSSKNSISISDISTTGAALPSTFLAGDGSWKAVSSGGGSVYWGDVLGNILNQTDLATALSNKVDKVSGKQLSSEDFTGTEKSKLSGIEQGAQVNPSASQIKVSYESNANTNAFTDLEKNKLASIEGSHFRGQYTSLSALNSAVPIGDIGDYAFVDLGVGQDVGKYIWDSNDVKWVIQQGQSSAMTPGQIKSGYESNADTNAYTDAEKNKLASAITSETDPTVPSWAKQPTKPAYTKGEVGLANVDNIQQATKSEFISHDNDSVRHITSAERNNWNAAAGAGLSLGETSTTAYRGDRGVTAYNHSQSTHAPTNAQKNSDITKAEIEAKLTGAVTTHTHSTTQISDFPEILNLVGGSNITVVESGNDIIISSSGGGEPAEKVNLVAGSNITIQESGQNLIISSSGGGGGDPDEAMPIAAGSNISLDIVNGELVISSSGGGGSVDPDEAMAISAGEGISLNIVEGVLVISSSGGGGGGSAYISEEQYFTLSSGDITDQSFTVTLSYAPVMTERRDVFLNGILIPNTLISLSSTQMTVNLSTLSLTPIESDFVVVKYSRS